MLTYKVYLQDFNRKSLEEYNILSHRGFMKSIAAHTSLPKNEFAEAVKNDLLYYFWSKCEYEIVISGWPNVENNLEKVDAYDQVMLNFDIFIDYLWSHRQEIQSEKS